jgi:hypothetical protein
MRDYMKRLAHIVLLFVPIQASLLFAPTSYAQEQGDAWSQAVKKGIKQESGKTDDDEARELELEAIRSKVRFEMALLFGGLFIEKVSTEHGSFHTEGFSPLIRGGIRYGISSRFDFVALASLQFRIGSDVSTAYSGYSSNQAIPPGTTNDFFMVMPGVDTQFRFRPVSTTSIWNIGVGISLNMVFFSGTYNTSIYIPSTNKYERAVYDETTTRFVFQGVLENTFSFGKSEQFQIPIRAAFGPIFDSKVHENETNVPGYIMHHFALFAESMWVIFTIETVKWCCNVAQFI